MDKKIAEIIVKACHANGYEAEIYEGYSGRGMYGEETVGVTVDNKSELIESIINDSELFDGLSFAGGLRHDSLGLGIIIY